jgi:hypothetical protein
MTNLEGPLRIRLHNKRENYYTGVGTAHSTNTRHKKENTPRSREKKIYSRLRNNVAAQASVTGLKIMAECEP